MTRIGLALRCCITVLGALILASASTAQTGHNPRSLTSYKPFNQWMHARYGRKHRVKQSANQKALAAKADAAWAWHTRGMTKNAHWKQSGRAAWARHNAGMSAEQNRRMAEEAWRKHTGQKR